MIINNWILDDIREYRSSKIISNISNGLATAIIKNTRNRQMTNFQMNLIRSSVAFVTSEVLNKVFEKPLKIIENIEMFIKVGKAVYKLIIWLNEESKRYEVKQESIQKISSISIGYRQFLRQNPKIKNAYKYQDNLDKMLSKKVKVIVDRPLGSRHPDREDFIYLLNYGYIEGVFAYDGKEQDAYIIGENKPLTKFQGQVISVINRMNDIENKLVVAAVGKNFHVKKS